MTLDSITTLPGWGTNGNGPPDSRLI